jgi:hypothetical protein
VFTPRASSRPHFEHSKVYRSRAGFSDSIPTKHISVAHAGHSISGAKGALGGSGLSMANTKSRFPGDSESICAPCLSFHCRLMLVDYSGGRSCSSNLPMSGERKGSSPSQSMHRYLRPRVPFTSASFRGLWHFGQSGGFEAFMAQRNLTFSATMLGIVFPRNPNCKHLSY